MASAREDRKLALRIGAAVTLFLLLVGQAQVTVVDGSSMLAVAQSIVHHASVGVPAQLGVPGRNGDYYSKYGVLLPLLSTPLVALAQPIGVVTGRVDLLEAALAASIMPVVGGALAAALYALGRRLEAPRPAATLVAVGTVLGTYVLPYGRDFFTEPLVALGLVVMIERALAGRELQAGAALGFAILARPQSAAFAPLLWAFLALERPDGLRTAHARREATGAILRTLPPLAIVALVTIAYNLARFGDPLQFGYKPPADPGFTTPLLEGARGLLLSPEKSVVLFAPVIVLAPMALVALHRRRRVTTALLVAIFAVSFVLAATWHSWMGGWSWGPRLLVPAVVAVLVALGPWIGDHASRMWLAGALFAVGLLLSLPAVIAPVGVQLLQRDPGADGPKVVRQARELPQLTRASLDAADDPQARDEDYRRYLALWQAGVVRQLGGVGFPVAILGTITLLAALWGVARPIPEGLRRG